MSQTLPTPSPTAPRTGTVVWLLTLMMVLVPAIGAHPWAWTPDTPKTILLTGFSLGAAFVFFWSRRNRSDGVVFHGVILLPLGLALYAVVSMMWSHTYLAGGDAVRWLLFSLVLWLGTNVFTPVRVTHLAWGVHVGAVMAALWAVLQFWVDLQLFPQGPNPASTFGNRNVLAEFLVCTLPFSVLLLTRVRSKAMVFGLTATVGLNVVAVLMTGTRSALVALLILVAVLPALLWRYRPLAGSSGWSLGHKVALGVVFVSVLATLGSIDSGNASLLAEHGRGDALDRALGRSQSVVQSDEFEKGSFSVRVQLWLSTGRMILANPLLGVGAGAWEVQVPLHQAEGAQLESDYYAHNEFVQLVSEYGLVGWLFLLGLLAYLVRSVKATWSQNGADSKRDAPVRALALTSILMLMVVSNAGFPWHMVGTSALFAVSLAVLAASDVRLGNAPVWRGPSVAWKAAYSWLAMGLTVAASVAAAYFSWQAVVCEALLQKAVEQSHRVSQAGDPGHPRWNGTKADIFRLARQAIGINPHYSTATAMLAENAIRWGDWENAIWLMKATMSTRPNEVALLVGVSRAYLTVGKPEEAQVWFNRAARVQPSAPYVRVQKAYLLLAQRDYQLAADIIAERLDAHGADHDLVNAAYILGEGTRDWRLAIRALEQQIKNSPKDAANAWLDLGELYSRAEIANQARAVESYRNALSLTPGYLRNRVWQRIPPSVQRLMQP